MKSSWRHRNEHALALTAALVLLAASVSAAQSGGALSSTKSPSPRAPYIRRGDEVEQRYKIHRERLEHFFRALKTQLEKDAPDLLKKLDPPAPVPFGYELRPSLLTDPPARSESARIKLSPFSWPRTDSIIDRGRDSLALLEPRLDSAARLTADEQRREYGLIVDEYLKLVRGQKFMASMVQYNRFWQSEIVRFPEAYKRNNALRDAALSRQALLDSIAGADEQFKRGAQDRIARFSRPIDSALQKTRTPDFIRVEHPANHAWIVHVPLYTDITDSAFITRAQDAIENGWHVHDGDDDFSVKLDVRRISPSQLYANAVVPANGQHIDIAAHLKRFPKDGAVLTTGANTTYVLGWSILLGPSAIPRRTLVHEFGHLLGFKDGYFRSYEDRGEDGFKVVEVILNPEDIVAAPEYGKAKRQHFEQILKERLKQPR